VDLRERLAHEVRGILKEAKATALFVTHDQLEAFAIGDKIGVIHDGHLHQWDSAYRLYHRPATRFVADFIGHGVFLPAELPHGDHGVVLHTALGDLLDGDECPCPRPTPAGSAMCCCAPTTSCTTTMHRCRRRFCARRSAVRNFSTRCGWTAAQRDGPCAQPPRPRGGSRVGIRLDMDHVVTFPREEQLSPVP
jgi:iron(III) transport system ATP-binding protein